MDERQGAWLGSAADAFVGAWATQWALIEEENIVLGAEYLATVAVAQALAAVEPGRIVIERLIGRAFCNTIMRQRCSVAAALRQGRIDVTIFTDTNHIVPECLIELKRDLNIPAIHADADRIATLVESTDRQLPNLFGFCLFPIRTKPNPGPPVDHEGPVLLELAKVEYIIEAVQAAHPNVSVELHHEFQRASISRPAVVIEEYEDGSVEPIWDSSGFDLMAVALVVEKRAPAVGAT